MWREPRAGETCCAGAELSHTRVRGDAGDWPRGSSVSPHGPEPRRELLCAREGDCRGRGAASKAEPVCRTGRGRALDPRGRAGIGGRQWVAPVPLGKAPRDSPSAFQSVTGFGSGFPSSRPLRLESGRHGSCSGGGEIAPRCAGKPSVQLRGAGGADFALFLASVFPLPNENLLLLPGDSCQPGPEHGRPGARSDERAKASATSS